MSIQPPYTPLLHLPQRLQSFALCDHHDHALVGIVRVFFRILGILVDRYRLEPVCIKGGEFLIRDLLPVHNEQRLDR